jgi:hypothetical protein
MVIDDFPLPPIDGKMAEEIAEAVRKFREQFPDVRVAYRAR